MHTELSLKTVYSRYKLSCHADAIQIIKQFFFDDLHDIVKKIMH